MQKSFYFQWHYLEQCNLRCKHCYQSAYTHSQLSDEQLIEIAKKLDIAAARFGVKARVSLTGGEPLLAPITLFKLLDFFESSDNFAHIGILTNGTLITDELADKLSCYNKLKEVQVSLDGATSVTHDLTRGPGAFQKAVSGISCLVKHGIFTSMMYTITTLNYHEAVNALFLAKRLSINAIALERVTPTGPRCTDKMSISPDILKQIFHDVYRYKLSNELSPLIIRTSRPLWALTASEHIGGYCPAGFSCLAILHDGTLLPCRRLEIPIGNVLTDGIFKPWYTSNVLWQLRNRALLNIKCSKCEFVHDCRGCRAAAHSSGNGIMGEDPSCWK